MSAEILPLGLRDRQRVERQESILVAAWDLLAGKAYDQWTLADLAEKAGVSRRTLYLHFPSKEAIAAGTVARNLLLLIGQMRLVAPDAAPRARLEAVMQWFVAQRIATRPGPVRALKAEPGLMSVIRTFPVYQAASAVLRGEFTALLQAAQNEGTVTRRLSADTLAGLLLDLFGGSEVTRWRTTGGHGDELVALVFDGLGGR